MAVAGAITVNASPSRRTLPFLSSVFVFLINPKNTSKIGEQKYSYCMKLTTHQAAAYVIARRYQGFSDNLIKTA